MPLRNPSLLLLSLAVLGAITARAAAPERLPDGVIVPLRGTFLRISVLGENIIRVACAPDRAFFSHPSLAVIDRPAPAAPAAPWSMETAPGALRISTRDLTVRVDLADGAVTFLDPAGAVILAEKPGGRELEPAEVQGYRTFHVRQQWLPEPGELLYGLGQHQLGILDLKGRNLDLWQHNTNAAVPFLVSSRGYGILWDNPSYTRFGDLREPQPIPAACLADADGRRGALTGSTYAGPAFGRRVSRRRDARIAFAPAQPVPPPTDNDYIDPALPPGDASVRWEGTITPPASGLYTFQADFNDRFTLWIDGRRVIDHWRQDWLPGLDEARVRLVAGRPVRIRAEWIKDTPAGQVALRWLEPSSDSDTSLWSQVGSRTDYYFVYGPDLDRVVAGYRRLTGEAPMMPIWAFGLFQSRQRYRTEREILGSLAGYRALRIPIDVIVQDWFYWPEDAWGSHRFDPARYPDPAGMIRAIHRKYHARFMISVWPKFYPGTANFKALQSRGFLYEPNLWEGLRDWVGAGHFYTFYDAFSPEARKLYWDQIDRSLFRLGVDAWWLDASEPDLLARPSLAGTLSHMDPTALGPASRVLNAYPLVHTEGVYQGQRKAAPDQRVFILTRSAYAGEQRNAAATWSGDTTSTWTAMRLQIAAGLGFSLSGIPYWTMDVGGFAVPSRWSTPHPAAADLAEWRELNARWFEFGTFVPILRVHGEFPDREMWDFGGDGSPVYRAELKFDRLRYRMLPYLYSLAGAVTADGGTLLRPLVMDFRSDPRARDRADEYLFGPAFLVTPVTAYRARRWPVYLPSPARWYDFWTGVYRGAGGRTITAAAPLDQIPVQVRAGSIVPFGPELQYTTEKPADPVILTVYTGADGAFTLYTDDGLTYGYEHGACARIPLRWDDAAGTLTIGARVGSFPGMLRTRTFKIVWVAPDRPVGFSFSPRADRTVRYDGRAVAVRLP